ncbi:MAG: septum formation initiator family protein [Candidatus Desulfofervidaceae bacterium]|nr:septum formation initiator family protein [Candidatus Desulfofervidaceae bacterium]MDL1970577.1 septum formation initiator family protein [Candidatus Desulfofervidaceae bacterium]
MRREFFLLIAIIISSFTLIVFGKNGYLDLCRLQKTRARILQQNQRLAKENSEYKRRIKRLKTDPTYFKTIVRQTMGLTEKDEIVFFLPRED